MKNYLIFCFKELGIEKNYMSSVKIYIIALYWASSMLTGNSLPYIHAQTVQECTIALFTVFGGELKKFLFHCK